MRQQLPAPSWPALVLMATALIAGLPWRRALLVVAPVRRPVLVYLANETRPGAAGAPAFAEVERRLLATGDALASEAALSLATDRIDFPAAVDAELRALSESALPRLFLATNATLRDGHALFRRAPGPLGAYALSPPRTRGDFVVDESPLATLDGLSRVLEAARELFPPADHEYVVILKSHGRGGLAAIPRLTVRPERFLDAELLALVHGEGVPADDGVKRTDLLDLIDEAGIEVPLLVLECCEGGLGLSSDALPPRVSAVAASTGATDYRGFEFARLGSDGVKDLESAVEARADLGLLRRAPSPRPLALLPVLLVLVVFVRERRRGLRGNVRECKLPRPLNESPYSNQNGHQP